jgi:BirA family biotin operon repressor/biotin-[acetyl-CoA-carboxylase] ligase
VDVKAAFDRAVARSAAVPRDMRWFPSVTSTMDVAQELAGRELRRALVVVAHEQTNGRGRRGRAWSSPPGAGLYISFALHPHAPSGRPDARSLLTLAAGVAVRMAIESATGLTPELKWPNDVMIGRRKLAGILAEASGVGTADGTIVLGIGINVLTASHPDDVAIRATSLEAEIGRRVDRALVLEEVLVAVSDVYDGLQQGKSGDILRQWRAAAPSAEGAVVEWNAHDGLHRGTTEGIDDDGALLVRTSSGLERIVGGEVNWL